MVSFGRASSYARWKEGEVDIVFLDPGQRLSWAVEVKWSDRFVDRPSDLKAVIGFCRANDLQDVKITSRSRISTQIVEGIRMEFSPASLYCYTAGLNAIKGLRYRR
jgi:uncharacterized protein